MHIVDIIRKKRDGAELTPGEIGFVVTGAASGSIPEDQVAAWLMAAFLRGFTPAELHALTTAMRFSGEVFDSSNLGKSAVDKHSTGGVGDSTSFLVAPIAAAGGVSVPMISGRALGHTGGTLDKLESIPGYRTRLSLDEMHHVVEETGVSIVGQTESLVPADRVLYALRDRTGTVENPYLICASIMSKKLAAGLNGLVLDVKTGSGAFLKSEEESHHLASLMVQIGEASGTRTVALITDMNQPLGRFAGNWLEIWESVEVLQGRRSPLTEDVRDLSLALAGWMLHIGGVSATPEAGRARAEELLTSGEALRVFRHMVAAQGGDVGVLDNPAAFHHPGARKTVTADRSGYLVIVDCEYIGWAVQRLGAGRTKPGEPVDPHAGIEMHTKLGSRVKAGDPLATMFAADDSLLHEPEVLLQNALVIEDAPEPTQPLIRQIVTVEDTNKARLSVVT